MTLPFLKKSAGTKRDQMLAVDLGNRTTKAVHLARKDGGMALCGYALLDAPIFEREMSADLLAEHLKAVAQALQPKTKLVALTLSANDAVVRSVDTPRLPMDDLRSVLKHNSRTYLQQELPGYVFDGHVMLSYVQPDAGKPGQITAGLQKQRVLVAAARSQQVTNYVEGAKAAGLVPDHIIPGMVGPVNAFELAQPEVFQNESVALVDIGFKHSSICVLQKGELVLSRIVALGGDRLTASLSESMNISYAEAEGIKVGMPQEVQSALESVLVPLGRELRASIDFFEHQQDKVVSRVFISGGSARSDIVMNTMQAELMVECKTWDPTRFLQVEVPPQQTTDLAEVAPQLAVAIGAALTAL